MKIIPVNESIQKALIALKVFNNMREADYFEMRYMGYNDMFYITQSINNSAECFAIYEGDTLLGVGGVIKAKDLGWGVPVWFVGTQAAEEYSPKKAIIIGKKIIQALLQKYPKLYNYISVDNEKAIHYIRLMGATLYPPQRWGIRGELFVPFVLERK